MWKLGTLSLVVLAILAGWERSYVATWGAAEAMCLPGSYVDEDGGFCVKVPAAYSLRVLGPKGERWEMNTFAFDPSLSGPEHHVLWIQVERPNFRFHEIADVATFTDPRWLLAKRLPGWTIAATGTLPNGGAWGRWEAPEVAPGESAGVRVFSSTRGARTLATCELDLKANDPDRDALIEACKTLVVWK